ncbi:MAG: flagellar hook-length control protein FliK [Deltaproteobacteria bacterium]|jgi:flagellar hook-length control protein FliK|nr:flagellar hook-length control protein FliK [Deltaproteobacteria bacterium]
MQFLPALTASEFPAAARSETNAVKNIFSGKNLLKGMPEALKASGVRFAELLGEKALLLQEFNSENTPGIAPGFKSVKDDKSPLSSGDLNYFQGKLLEKGVDEEVLQKFMSVFYAAPELPSVGKIMGAARNSVPTDVFLNDQEKIAFTNFTQRLGFTTEEIARLENLSAGGKGSALLRSLEHWVNALENGVNTTLENIPASNGTTPAASRLGNSGKIKPDNNLQNKEKTAVDKVAENTGKVTADGQKTPAVTLDGFIHITKEEAAALTKALNLSPRTSENILNRFDDAAELEMNSQEFSKLFAEAGFELDKEETQMNKIRALVPEAVRAMLQNAKIIKVSAADADNRASVKTKNSEALIRETALLLDEDEDSQRGKVSNIRKSTVLGDILDKAGKPVKAEVSGKIAETTLDAHPATRTTENSRSGEEQREAFDENLAHRFGSGRRQEAERSPAAAKPQVNENIDPGKEALTAKTAPAGIIFSQPAAEASSARNPQPDTAEIYRERIYERLEQGIIKNAIQGSRQIILRLDPPDLGRLTLNLTVANGEIKALIRTEHSEVTQAVAEQLAQLKNSLEEQGFKVADLDVQTRTQDQADMQNRDGSGQQELKEKMEAEAEFLRLARLGERDKEALAWSMHNNTHTATIAETGLHLVA